MSDYEINQQIRKSIILLLFNNKEKEKDKLSK